MNKIRKEGERRNKLRKEGGIIGRKENKGECK